jgi:hypothetical protein
LGENDNVDAELEEGLDTDEHEPRSRLPSWLVWLCVVVLIVLGYLVYDVYLPLRQLRAQQMRIESLAPIGTDWSKAEPALVAQGYELEKVKAMPPGTMLYFVRWGDTMRWSNLLSASYRLAQRPGKFQNFMATFHAGGAPVVIVEPNGTIKQVVRQ